MKRFFVVLMAIILAMSCIACSGSEKTQSEAPQSSVNETSDDISQDISLDEEEEEVEEEKPDITDDGFSIVVKMKSSNATINSIEDFSKYTVAYVTDTDSEIYAKFYDFKEIGAYNAVNDLHSGLMGGAFELGIVSTAGYEAFAEDYDIVWDFSKNP